LTNSKKRVNINMLITSLVIKM